MVGFVKKQTQGKPARCFHGTSNSAEGTSNSAEGTSQFSWWKFLNYLLHLFWLLSFRKGPPQWEKKNTEQFEIGPKLWPWLETMGTSWSWIYPRLLLSRALVRTASDARLSVLHSACPKWCWLLSSAPVVNSSEPSGLHQWKCIPIFCWG